MSNAWLVTVIMLTYLSLKHELDFAGHTGENAVENLATTRWADWLANGRYLIVISTEPMLNTCLLRRDTLESLLEKHDHIYLVGHSMGVNVNGQELTQFFTF